MKRATLYEACCPLMEISVNNGRDVSEELKVKCKDEYLYCSDWFMW